MQATIPVNLPENAYHQLERAAKRQQRSVEELVEAFAAEHADVPAIEPDLETELEAMPKLSNATLVKLAQARLSTQEASKLQMLLATSDRNLSQDQQLETLVDLSDRVMLIKAQALDILRGRGQDIQTILTAA